MSMTVGFRMADPLFHHFKKAAAYSSIQHLLHVKFITSDPIDGEDHIHEFNRANIIMDIIGGMCTLQTDSEHCRSDPVQVQSATCASMCSKVNLVKLL